MHIRCPEGEVPVQKCNATADMKCGPPPSGTLRTEFYKLLIPLISVSLFIGIIGTVILCCMKCYASRRKKEKDANIHFITSSTADLLSRRKNSSTDVLRPESQEVQPYPADPDSVSHYSDMSENIHLPSSSTKEASSSEAAPLLHLKDKPGTDNGQLNVSPSNAECSAVIKASQDELSEICAELMNKVRVYDWIMLMRIAGLSDNEIDIIKQDYPSDTREQNYRMLKTLCDKLGTEKALYKLLNGLRKMKLINIYQNLENELLSRNITIKEDNSNYCFVKNAEHQNR